MITALEQSTIDTVMNEKLISQDGKTILVLLAMIFLKLEDMNLKG